jgi:hypothetical protein
MADAKRSASSRSGVPDQVGIRGVCQATGDRLIHAGLRPVEALLRALAGEEARVGLVGVAQQQVRAEGVRPRD